MSLCDGFFGDLPFEPEYEDEAVYLVRSADFYDPAYKKWLILCWFHETYGGWEGSRFNARDASVRMAAFLTRSGFSSYEELLAAEDEPPL